MVIRVIHKQFHNTQNTLQTEKKQISWFIIQDLYITLRREVRQTEFL